MLATKNWYAIGMNRRTGNFTTSAANIGLSSMVTESVAVNSHLSLLTPVAAATSSRIGRKTK